MDFLPIFLNLRNQPCLVIGGGNTATRKVDLLLQAHAQVTIVAPQLTTQLTQWAETARITCHQREFVPSDIDRCQSLSKVNDELVERANIYRLIIAATDNKAVNQQISQLAQQLGIPVNVVDQPELCSFIMPAIIDRSPLQIAISSGGTSPVLARLLRAKVETVIPANYAQLAQFLANLRDKVKKCLPNVQTRRRFWESVLQGSIADRVLAGQTAIATTELEKLLNKVSLLEPVESDSLNSLRHAQGTIGLGEVYLVGGGPGDPDLLTFRALRLMQQADVVVYDRLISQEVLNLTRRDAERIYVGKAPNNHTLPQQEINQLLIRLAKQGKRVLRLKGGDPFVFGRGGEEIETLLAEGIVFQVVPGITAALGAAAYAGIPLTHRDYAQACVFVTGHLKDNSMNLNWKMLVQPHQTIVVYMGLRGVNILCRELIEHGMPTDKPAALVQQATTSDQRVLVGTLTTLPALVETAQIKLPSLVIVGEVVKLHEKLAWFSPPQPVDNTND